MRNVQTFLDTARERAKAEEGSVCWTTLKVGFAFYGCPKRGWRFLRLDTQVGQCAGGFVKDKAVKSALTALYTQSASWAYTRRLLNGKPLVKADGKVA